MTLVEFLLARIAEDEEWAQYAAEFGSAKWSPDDLGHWMLGGDWQPMTQAEAEHIARHDPARVLAECEAKRRIVEHAEPDLIAASPGDPYVLSLLAAVYADHPDYDETWRA